MSTWIWDSFHRQVPNRLLLFRRVLETQRPLVDASLAIAARGAFRLYVDGRQIAHHDLQSSAPGAESLHFDLSAGLGGANRVEILIGVLVTGVGTHHQPAALGGLWAEGALNDSAGVEYRLDSSPDWEVSAPGFWRQNTSQRAWSTGYAEWSDLREIPGGPLEAATLPGWSPAVTFEDHQVPEPFDREVVETAVELDPFRTETGSIPSRPSTGLSRAHDCAALGTVRLLASASARGDDQASTYELFRLPHQVVGFVELTIEAADDVVLDLAFGETVDEAGWPSVTRQGIAAVDTLVVGAGTTTHRFWNRRTGMSLAVIGRTPGSFRVAAARWCTVTAARPDVEFASGDVRLDRIHAISAVTAAIGRQDFYEDCPLREGGHYVADARVQALLDLASTGETRLAQRSLRQFASSTDPDGMIPALTPSGTDHRLPDFALQWVAAVAEYVRFTGDTGTARDLWPAVTGVMRWAAGRWDPALLSFDAAEPGWWTFIDWDDFTTEARQAALDADYLVALGSAAWIADALDDTIEAERHRVGLAAARRRFSRPAHDPHAVVILLTGLGAVQAGDLVDPAVLDNFTPRTGYFAFWTCLAHLALGDSASAWALLDRYWGAMLDAGATTWWEAFDFTGTSAIEDVSLCHPWSAGPLVLLPMLLVGVNPFALDETGARLEPHDHPKPAAFTLYGPGARALSPLTLRRTDTP